MNKQLFDYCQRLLKKHDQGGAVKLTPFARTLHLEYGFGDIDRAYLYFSYDQRLTLIQDIKKLLALDVLSQEYQAKSRQDNAQTKRNEKDNSYAVGRDFVLINSLESFQFNGKVYPAMPFTSLGLYVKAQEIKSIQHKQIVFVENLEIMANLPALNLPEQLDNPLWIYRGDIQEKQHTGTAYAFFKGFNNDQHELICFSDLDPAGIQIALTCDAQYWLTPNNSAVIEFSRAKDVEKEWYKQNAAIQYLKNIKKLPAKCQTAFDLMLNNRKTLKQEHMLAHQIPLGLYKL
ncbi:hypothetical protein Ping_1854 [Psychromonas ingrahamii 37]|uniref:DUF7281 domain-containing protein n=1 Tax=Psychromonas ingrahamii (strain DSM 17664 / CCUG 51855 / 37) TaxID=357804 RepID=A1SVW6_PSYIN|nr:hypothetical protein [Psychromonas ingrahamii]ABM03631.1 hypothetical protein Ping_1854 [Psychromonas ingrahamii 37]